MSNPLEIIANRLAGEIANAAILQSNYEHVVEDLSKALADKEKILQERQSILDLAQANREDREAAIDSLKRKVAWLERCLNDADPAMTSRIHEDQGTLVVIDPVPTEDREQFLTDIHSDGSYTRG